MYSQQMSSITRRELVVQYNLSTLGLTIVLDYFKYKMIRPDEHGRWDDLSQDEQRVISDIVWKYSKVI